MYHFSYRTCRYTFCGFHVLIYFVRNPVRFVSLHWFGGIRSDFPFEVLGFPYTAIFLASVVFGILLSIVCNSCI